VDTLPAEPEFIRISEGQKRVLAGDIFFELSNAGLSGLPLPMLGPDSFWNLSLTLESGLHERPSEH
jgi:alpha-galactosidase